MAMDEFGTIRANCDNCGRHHDESVAFETKDKKVHLDEETKWGLPYTWERVPHQFNWNEINARKARKKMMRYLKIFGWQVDKNFLCCKECLNEKKARLIAEYEANDDSDSLKEVA